MALFTGPEWEKQEDKVEAFRKAAEVNIIQAVDMLRQLVDRFQMLAKRVEELGKKLEEIEEKINAQDDSQ